MYNERVGAFTLVAEDEATAARAHSQVKTIIRTLYSNPASHGANTIALVLKDADLDLAVKSILASRVGNTGQICNCAERAMSTAA